MLCHLSFCVISRGSVSFSHPTHVLLTLSDDTLHLNVDFSFACIFSTCKLDFVLSSFFFSFFLPGALVGCYVEHNTVMRVSPSAALQCASCSHQNKEMERLENSGGSRRMSEAALNLLRADKAFCFSSSPAL